MHKESIMQKHEILAVVEMMESGIPGVPSVEAVKTHISRVWRNLGGDVYDVSYVETAICLKRAGDERYQWQMMPLASQVKAHLRAIREWREAGADI